MDVQAASISMAMEVASVRMEKQQMQQQGDAALKLLESTPAAPVPAADPAQGNSIDTYA